MKFRNLKGVLALVLSIMMVLVSVAAIAEDFEETKTFEIKLNDNAAHDNFVAVQIFKGEQEATPDNSKLGNIVWGDNITADLQTKIIAAINEVYALTGESAIATTAAAKDVAKKLESVATTKTEGGLAFDAAKENALAKKLGLLLKDVAGTQLTSGGKNEVPAGYYLIIDKSTGVEDNKSDAFNASLLQMTHDIVITKKTDAPTVEKKIIEATAVDSDTKKIGDHVAYEITSTIPDHSHYDYYFFVINDDLSAGLKYDNNVVVYKAEPNTGADKETKPYNDEVALSATGATPDYYVYTGADADGHSFQVALDNAKALPVGTKIIVRFTAELLSTAVVGEKGNPNETSLIYSNKPDDSGRGDHEDTNHKGKPDSTKGDVTGETLKDIVITYTSQMTILKVDDNNQALNGAEFTITGTGTTTHLKGTKKFVETEEGATHYKLFNGKYTTEAPVEAKMEEAASGATAGYVEDSTYTEPDKRVYGGKTYRPYVAETDEGKTIYIENLGNADKYESLEKKYKEIDVTETSTETFNIKEVLTVDGATHTIKGLPAGTYTIEETKVPTGFNKVENKTLVIKCELPTTVTTEDDTATWSIDTDNSSAGWAMDTAATANYKITIQNLSGATLPETGGIGTTIFYVAGSILVLAAAILLITKRRMGAND